MRTASTESANRRLSGPIALVAGLWLFAGLAVVDARLELRGAWLASPAASVIYRSLWSLLWLVNMALCGLLLSRRRRAWPVVGLLLQGAALALTWGPEQCWALSRALGGLGLVLPLFAVRWRAKARIPLFAALLLSLPFCLYWADGWSSAALMLAIIWAVHACAIWPTVGESIARSLREEERLRRDSRAYRCLERAVLAVLAAGAAAVASALVCAGILWLRLGSLWP